MSRSYKKFPVVKDSGSKRWAKRQASKSVRRYKDRINNGCLYKKCYCSWNINDVRIYKPWNIEQQRDYIKKQWCKSFYWK